MKIKRTWQSNIDTPTPATACHCLSSTLQQLNLFDSEPIFETAAMALCDTTHPHPHFPTQMGIKWDLILHFWRNWHHSKHVVHRSKMVQATTGIPVWLRWDYHHPQACIGKLSPAALGRPLWFWGVKAQNRGLAPKFTTRKKQQGNPSRFLVGTLFGSDQLPPAAGFPCTLLRPLGCCQPSGLNSWNRWYLSDCLYVYRH